MKKSEEMRKADFIVIFIVLIIFLIWFFPSAKGSVAKVYINGEEYASLPLSENASLPLDTVYGRNTVVIEKGTVFVTEATCPDKLCEKHRIQKCGQSIICLPNRVSIVIEGNKNETDVIL